jgi:hypothetical protein
MILDSVENIIAIHLFLLDWVDPATSQLGHGNQVGVHEPIKWIVWSRAILLRDGMLVAGLLL